MNTIKSSSLFAAMTILLALLIPACGGGGGGGGGGIASGGIGGTGITTGTITGFGSVFVNGVEFGTASTLFNVDDDNTASENDLGIGMVVTVVGTVNPDGISGTADSIEYDDEVEGPIAATPVEDPDMVTKTFDVFDLSIVVDRNSTVFVNTGYAGLAANDIVEVSGFFDGPGNLLATRLEKVGVLGTTTTVEVKGTVDCAGGMDCIGTFTLGSLDITYDGLTDLTEVPGGVIAAGQFVEVKGILTPPASIAATRIELEEESLGNNIGFASIEGIVTDFISIGNFKVSGQPVDASGFAVNFEPATLATTISNGDEVEVEGPIVGGVLQATDVEQRGGDVRISAAVNSVNAAGGTITMAIVSGQLLTVTVDNQTLFEDKTGGIGNLTIFNIAAGNFLNIEAFSNGGTLTASQVERDAPDDTRLQGPADIPPTNGNGASGQVSILGVNILTGGSTEFEDANDNNIGAAAFFGSVADGDLIAFTDTDNDGLAEEVEFE